MCTSVSHMGANTCGIVEKHSEEEYSRCKGPVAGVCLACGRQEKPVCCSKEVGSGRPGGAGARKAKP